MCIAGQEELIPHSERQDCQQQLINATNECSTDDNIQESQVFACAIDKFESSKDGNSEYYAHHDMKQPPPSNHEKYCKLAEERSVVATEAMIWFIRVVDAPLKYLGLGTFSFFFLVAVLLLAGTLCFCFGCCGCCFGNPKLQKYFRVKHFQALVSEFTSRPFTDLVGNSVGNRYFTACIFLVPWVIYLHSVFGNSVIIPPDRYLPNITFAVRAATGVQLSV